MAEHEEDLEVSRRYRELGREDPPRALDDAIRAEARRSAASHPAPLVPPTGRSRWYFPVAAAAIIVLAVAVTVQMEREQPDSGGPLAEAPTKQSLQGKNTIQEKREEPAAAAPAEKPRSRASSPAAQSANS